MSDRECGDCQEKIKQVFKYQITLATERNIDEILNLYHSLVGTDGCTWDLNYPSIDDIKDDIYNKSLYAVWYNQEIIAVAAAGKDNFLTELMCFSKQIKSPSFLARIGVKPEYQNKGLAKHLIEHLENQMKKIGFDGMHFLVSKTNLHALAVYNKMNYQRCGECNMFGQDWYCYEKKF